MSAYLYDESIVTKLRDITRDSKIYISPADNVIRTIGSINSDNIRLPMISLTRTGISLLDSQSHFMRFEGLLAKYNESNNKLQKLQAIPIRINYLIDVWTKNREENDNIIRELIFYISTHPTLKVSIPFGLNIEHNFNLFIDSDIEDNSDIIEHKNRGEYFRQTISLYTDDSYLWKSSSRYPTYVEADVDVK